MEKSRIQIKQSATPIPPLLWGKISRTLQRLSIRGPLQSGAVVLTLRSPTSGISISITWEPVRNANSEVPPQTS